MNTNKTLFFNKEQLNELYTTLNNVLRCNDYDPMPLLQLREQIENVMYD